MCDGGLMVVDAIFIVRVDNFVSVEEIIGRV